jgi:hypothetical protein
VSNSACQEIPAGLSVLNRWLSVPHQIVMLLHRCDRVRIRPVFPGTVPFFIQMSRVNLKNPALSKYSSVFSLINAIWTDKKTDLKLSRLGFRKNRLKIV